MSRATTARPGLRRRRSRRPPPLPDGWPAAQDAPPDCPGYTGIDMARGHALRDLLAGGAPCPPTAVARAQAGDCGRRRGRAGGGALRCGWPGCRTLPCWSWKTSAGGNSRGRRGERHGLPAGRALPARARATTRPRCRTCSKNWACASAWPGARQYERAPPVSQPAGAPVLEGEWQEGLLPVHGRGRRHAGAIPPLRRAVARSQAARASPCRCSKALDVKTGLWRPSIKRWML